MFLKAAALMSSMFLGAQSYAVTTVYTDDFSFIPQLDSEYYLNFFAGALSPQAAANYEFTDGRFSYTVVGEPTVSPSGTWQNGRVIATNYFNSSLTINFTSGNVTALAGWFYAADQTGAISPAPVSIRLNDGTTTTFLPTSLSESFRGFISSVPITSITMSAIPLRLNAVDDLVVGMSNAAPVPEPHTTALFLMGLAAIGYTQIRRKALH